MSKLQGILGPHKRPLTHGDKLILSAVLARKERTRPTFESIAEFFLDAGLSVSFGRGVRQYNEVNGREIYLDGIPYVVLIMGEFMGISPMFLVMANSDNPIVGSEYKLVGDEYQFVFECF